MEYSKIGIIGAGAWGSALAIALSSSQLEIILWAKEIEVVESIKIDKENNLYLPNINLDSNITPTNNLEDISKCDVIFVVCPAQFTDSKLENLKGKIEKNIPIISCSKGIEKNTLLLQSEIINNKFPDNPVLILAGPTFASEVARKMPASLNLACKDENVARSVKKIFEKSKLSIHIINDIIGAQIGGILKNVIAIGCGMANGMKMGANLHSALITQGVKEASILAEALGGSKETLLDLAGIGDMSLTCSSKESRNFTFGFSIGEGSNKMDLIKKSKKAVEGYASLEPLIELLEKLKLDLPLCKKIYEILYKDSNPKVITSVI